MAHEPDPWRRLAEAARARLPDPAPATPAQWRARAAALRRTATPPPSPWGATLPVALALAGACVLACGAVAWASRPTDDLLPTLSWNPEWP